MYLPAYLYTNTYMHANATHAAAERLWCYCSSPTTNDYARHGAHKSHTASVRLQMQPLMRSPMKPLFSCRSAATIKPLFTSPHLPAA